MRRLPARLSLLAFFFVTDAMSADTTADIEIYIARHGRTMLNASDRVQGWSDAVLTPQGQRQAISLGRGLAKQGILFNAAYSSDSGRALQTARLLLAHNGQAQLPVRTDWRFREFNFGSYETLANQTLWQDIADQHKMSLAQWLTKVTPKDFADTVAILDQARQQARADTWPAENYAAIQQRLRSGMEQLISQTRQQGGGKVLLVSHGLSINALLDLLLPGQTVATTKLENASITRLRLHNGQYQLLDINDLRYLKTGQLPADISLPADSIAPPTSKESSQ
ncbi:histidine phosphatase family protein [Aquitalea sp.]|uniref:histidine phosphatase family protein n=1 Tax=Aquitalea sp. TaxID=1872623 RepID=UPI002583BC01|nr:histidine phosphatase family protein [Aquitalea sp.]